MDTPVRSVGRGIKDYIAVLMTAGASLHIGNVCFQDKSQHKTDFFLLDAIA